MLNRLRRCERGNDPKWAVGLDGDLQVPTARVAG